MTEPGLEQPSSPKDRANDDDDVLARWDNGGPLGYIAIATTFEGYPARGSFDNGGPGIASTRRDRVQNYIDRHQDSPVGRSLVLCEIRPVTDA